MTDQTQNPNNDPWLAEMNRVKSILSKPKDALSQIMNPDPAPLYYAVDPSDRSETPIILEQQRGADSLVDQFRDKIEAAQAVTKEAAEQAAKIHADPDLSDEGKAKRIAEIHRAALKKLATVADGLDKHDSIVREQVSEPLAYVESYQPQDYATPTIDIALVQAFKGLNNSERMQCIARMLEGNDQRMTDAILRMPTVLTGLSHTVLANLREAAVNRAHPEEVQRRRSLEKASSAARIMVGRVLDKLATNGRLTRQEQRELLGDAAKHFPHLY